MALDDWYMSDKAMNAWATESGHVRRQHQGQDAERAVGEIAKDSRLTATTSRIDPLLGGRRLPTSGLPRSRSSIASCSTPTPEQARRPWRTSRRSTSQYWAAHPSNSPRHRSWRVRPPRPPVLDAGETRGDPARRTPPAGRRCPAHRGSTGRGSTPASAAITGRNFWAALAFMAPALIFVGVVPAPAGGVQRLRLVHAVGRSSRASTGSPALANYTRLFVQSELRDAGFNTIDLGGRLVLPAGAVRARPGACCQGHPRRGDVSRASISCPGCSRATAVGVLWYYVYAGEGIVNRASAASSAADRR